MNHKTESNGFEISGFTIRTNSTLIVESVQVIGMSVYNWKYF